MWFQLLEGKMMQLKLIFFGYTVYGSAAPALQQ
jgi:hypothetical protein